MASFRPLRVPQLPPEGQASLGLQPPLELLERLAFPVPLEPLAASLRGKTDIDCLAKGASGYSCHAITVENADGASGRRHRVAVAFAVTNTWMKGWEHARFVEPFSPRLQGFSMNLP